MIRQRTLLAAGSLLLCGAAAWAALTVANWPAPANWTPPGGAGIRPLSLQSDISGPLPFIPTTPCRQYDSRTASALPDGTPRTITLSGAPCGLPSAAAVSVNITVFAITGIGGNGVFKVGIASPPTTSWINYPVTETQRANAGVVSTNGSGQIVVQVNQGGGSVQFTVDVNGYYSSAAANQGSTFKVVNNGATTVPAIWGETDSTSLNATGVFGLANATSGITDAVWGLNNSNSDLSVGVLGISAGTTGQTYGVYGRTNSTAASTAGVYGEAVGAAGPTIGVEGVADSSDTEATGVLGVASQAAANAGAFVNTGNGGVTFLCYYSGGDVFGIATNATIQGAALNIIGASKNFVAPHPLDPSKEIRYASVEAPTVDVYFRGTGTLANGYARIEIPDHFRLTAREGTYMTTLTPVGRPISLSVESEGSDGITVRGSGNSRFHYVVYAERAEIEGFEPVQKNTHFTPEALERVHMLRTLPPSTKALLIRNGTLNPDGTYNEETARAMGWKVPDPRTAEASRK